MNVFNLHYIIDIFTNPTKEEDWESLSQITEYHQSTHHQNHQIPSGKHFN